MRIANLNKMLGDRAAFIGAEAFAHGTFVERLLEMFLGDMATGISGLFPAEVASAIVHDHAVWRFRRATTRVLVFVEQRDLQQWREIKKMRPLRYTANNGAHLTSFNNNIYLTKNSCKSKSDEAV